MPKKFGSQTGQNLDFTVDKTYKEYIKHQLDIGDIEKALIQRMNSIRDWATEIVNNDLIYA